MSEMEDKLGAILSNPALMHQIMAMAQSMNQSPPAAAAPASPPGPPQSPPQPSPEPDKGMLQSLSGLAKGSGVDRNQQNLLSALSPYLSRGRVEKLERAMRAAKMAGMASSLFQSGALQSLIGR